jgi:hypothetical protein
MYRRVLTAFSPFVLFLIGCSAEQPEQVPSEQELHAAEVGGRGVVGRHHFMCENGTTLLVDFKAEGLGLQIRESETARPATLTAPSPGRPFVGEHSFAVIGRGKLVYRRGAEPVLTCARQTR